MSEPACVLQSVLGKNVVDQSYLLLLRACNEQQILTYKLQHKVQDVVSVVNLRLGDLSQRSAGIHLLKCLLTQCPDAVFIKNCVSWMRACVEGVLKPLDPSFEVEAYDTLRMLLKMSHHFQSLRKAISTEVIPTLLKHLINFHKSRGALQCLQEVLQYYYAPCKGFHKQIKMILIKFLNEEDKELVEYAARCACYFSWSVGEKPVGSWTTQQETLCAVANSLMYELFENVNEHIIPSVLVDLPAGFNLYGVKTKDPVGAVHLVATRLTNVLTFIEKMIQGEHTAVKEIRADVLVALAHRGLSINCDMLSRGRLMEHMAVMSVMPDIHLALLSLLQTLVSSCTGGLLKFGPLFCKLVVQVLKWTSVPSKYGIERPYNRVREAAYKFLESWIIRARAASCAELLGECLVNYIMQDIYQKKETISLQVTKNDKKVPAAMQTFETQAVREELLDLKANSELCETALRVAVALVQTSGSQLKQHLHVRLQEIAVSLLLELRNSSGPQDMPAPYSVAACRLQLYKLLLVLVLHPHPHWPPPIQFALALLSWGQHDQSLEVVAFNSMAMACMRQMIHPSRSSPQFPKTIEEMRESVGLQDNLQVQRSVNAEEGMEVDVSGSKTPTSANLREYCQSADLDNSVHVKARHTLNNEKLGKKKSRSSFCEVAGNGVETSFKTPDSSKRKRKSCTPTYETINTSTNLRECSPNPDVNNFVHVQASHSFNSEQLDKKKSETSRSEVLVNGFETSSKTPDSSKRKRKSLSSAHEVLAGDDGQKHLTPSSDKSSRKMHSSPILQSKKKKRNSTQEWEVTDVIMQEEVISKKKKKKKNDKSIEQSSTGKKHCQEIIARPEASKQKKKSHEPREQSMSPFGKKNCHESPKITPKENKSRKMNERNDEDLKQNGHEIIARPEAPKEKKKSHELREQSLSPFGKNSCHRSPKDISKINKSRNVNEQNDEEEEVLVIDLDDSDSEAAYSSKDLCTNGRNVDNSEIIPKDEIATEEYPVVELAESDVSDNCALGIKHDLDSFEIQDVTSEIGGDISTNEKNTSAIEIEKDSSATNNSDKDSVRNATVSGSQLVEAVVTSADVASVEVATPNESAAKNLQEKEVQKSNSPKKTFAFDVASIEDSAANEESTAKNLQEKGVQKRNSPKEIYATNSPNRSSKRDAKDMQRSLSDREMEETNVDIEAVVESPDVALEEACVSNEKECITNNIHLEDGEQDKHLEETSTSNNPGGAFRKDTKDLAVSDREMEEKTSGMDAIVNSPDIALDETAASNGEELTKVGRQRRNGQKEGVEKDSDSDSAEEDILKTFVDVVSPKST